MVELTAAVIILSWICGLVAALGKTSSHSVLRWPCEFYIWFIRGTPTLIQIFIVYFGIPQLGAPLVTIHRWGRGAWRLKRRLCRRDHPRRPRRYSQRQTELAIAIGMSARQCLQYIVLPQVVRIILPPITNEAVTTLKNTSLLSTITIVELTLKSEMIISYTFRPFDFYIIAAILYLAMTTSLMSTATWIEGRLATRY